MSLLMKNNGCERVVTGRQHKTHVDGTFYEMPHEFPCVLHDRWGCLELTQAQYYDLVRMNVIRESTGGARPKINIPNGIARIPGYCRCEIKNSCPKYRPRKK